ncbi:flagellar export chaperone FliS [Marinibactrum halimedae]|nr:flagellar export chaperone FliS [Marinibactrum halimedae]MCD9460869.1 flagellar export chaperone FliS [Marinibactrum halimedae]
MNTSHALAQYKQVNVQTSVMDASPHKLITLLIDGFIERVTQAKAALNAQKIEAKGERISKAIQILSGLRGALDFEKGGELASNLDGLYDYMARRLFTANANNDLDMLDEVIGLMRTVKEGWDGIKEQSAGQGA